MNITILNVLRSLNKICDDYADDLWYMADISGNLVNITDKFFIISDYDNDTAESSIGIYKQANNIRASYLSVSFKTSAHNSDTWLWNIKNYDTLILDNIWDENADFIQDAKLVDSDLYKFLISLPDIIKEKYPKIYKMFLQKSKDDITFKDFRNILIENNPIAKCFPRVKHGFITAEVCKKYNMAVMYNNIRSQVWQIDFMDIGAILDISKNGLVLNVTPNGGVIISTTINEMNPEENFDIKGLITAEINNIYQDLVEDVYFHYLNEKVIETSHYDIHGFYRKWISFMLDWIDEIERIEINE